MKVSWIVATHYRRRLLETALMSIAANTYPEGWDYEVLVSHHDRDHQAREVIASFLEGDRHHGVPGLNVLPVQTHHETGGGKRTAALGAARGDLVLAADDDDIQSPLRARVAIEAFSRGHSLSEVREFRYLDLETGLVMRWKGHGEAGRGQVICGTARNYRRSMLQKVRGWKPLPRLIEKDLQSRIAAMFPRHSRAFELGTLEPTMHTHTVCLQHGGNVWDDRPAIPRGAELDRGAFRIVGEGHYKDLPDLPSSFVWMLGAL